MRHESRDLQSALVPRKVMKDRLKMVMKKRVLSPAYFPT